MNYYLNTGNEYPKAVLAKEMTVPEEYLCNKKNDCLWLDGSIVTTEMTVCESMLITEMNCQLQNSRKTNALCCIAPI